ncbi:MAG: ATP-binding protein [Propylenella sp.]
MTEKAAPPTSGGAEPARRQPGRAFMPWSLSNKLLFLTLVFVMIAEVLIYIPSIANFRNVWLGEKLDTAELVAMAASAAPEESLPSDLEMHMLESIGVVAIAMRSAGQRWFIARDGMPSAVAAHHDLTELRPLDSVKAAFEVLFGAGDRLIMVSGPPPAGSDAFEIVVHEADLRAAMLTYSRNILVLSLVISVITASLVYAALRFQFVRPMQRLSANIVDFSNAPESASSIIQPSGRRDEIGVAEARLAEMQKTLREMLAQRRHLADLGLAVSKINHDLRNILASAQLFSDRMGSAEDPLVKRFAPKVIRAIDRAIDYTRSVLAYGQATEEAPRRQLLSLARLVDDVADVLALPGHERVYWESRVAAEVEVDADPEQLFRVMMNLCRNALEAVGESDDPAVIRRIWVEGERQGSVATIRVCDTGPGVPEKARENLFLPFQGSARRGGTGLGLAIAAEIVRAHGGDIRLADRAGAGAVFEVSIPDRPVVLDQRRHAQKR